MTYACTYMWIKNHKRNSIWKCRLRKMTAILSRPPCVNSATIETKYEYCVFTFQCQLCFDFMKSPYIDICLTRKGNDQIIYCATIMPLRLSKTSTCDNYIWQFTSIICFALGSHLLCFHVFWCIYATYGMIYLPAVLVIWVIQITNDYQQNECIYIALTRTNIMHTCRLRKARYIAIENQLPIGQLREPIFLREGYTRHAIR